MEKTRYSKPKNSSRQAILSHVAGRCCNLRHADSFTLTIASLAALHLLELTQQQPSNSRQPQQPSTALPRSAENQQPTRSANRSAAYLTHTHRPALHPALGRHMTITSHVQDQLFDTNESGPIRIAPSVVPTHSVGDDFPASQTRGMLWTAKEHEKFLDALEEYPKGPWKVIAERVGTRSVRQVMSHAQKYRLKIRRRNRDAAKQKMAQRKDQEQRKDASDIVPATIEKQPRTAAVVMDTSNSSVRAPVPSRFDLPPLEEVPAFREHPLLQVPSTQAYVVDASSNSGFLFQAAAFHTAYSSLSQTPYHFHQLTEATPDMNDTGDLMDWWWQYFLTLGPARTTASAAATSDRGIEHAERRVQDKLSETDELRLNSYALSPQSVRDVLDPAQLSANAVVSVFGNGSGGCVIHHV